MEQEQTTIAREVHDVPAHTLSVISVQASVAAEALADSRAAGSSGAARAVDAIRGVSGDALEQLRSTVRVLRTPEGNASASLAPGGEPLLAPVGGLDQLDRIVAATEHSGLALSVEIDGDPVPLPLVVDSAAHRIVLESVTNVLRHAGAASAEVSLTYRPESLTVRVSDDGRGERMSAANGRGYGIQGMRERAALLGGNLRAGPAPRCGFLVEASLPLDVDP